MIAADIVGGVKLLSLFVISTVVAAARQRAV